MEYLTEYDWPGNIRELENLIELIINTENLPLDFLDKKDSLIRDNKQIENKQNLSLEELERIHIEKILDKYSGNISKSAEVLDISRNTLYRKINNYKINVT